MCTRINRKDDGVDLRIGLTLAHRRQRADFRFNLGRGSLVNPVRARHPWDRLMLTITRTCRLVTARVLRVDLVLDLPKRDPLTLHLSLPVPVRLGMYPHHLRPGTTSGSSTACLP